jgi:uncharacterized membrane protein YfcA
MELLVIGLIAGVISGLFGIGGVVVIVPARIVVARMQPEMATGTSLASLLLPVGLLGAGTTTGTAWCRWPLRP